MFGDFRIDITAGEWDGWKNDPITRKVMAALAYEREDWHVGLVEGDTLVPGQEVVRTAKAVGILYGLDAMLIGVEEVLRRQWEEDRLKELEEAGDETS